MAFGDIVGKFMKKDRKEEGGIVSRTPVNDVLAMRGQGLTNTQIINQLRGQGFKVTEIKDAMMQADVKSGVVNPETGGGLPADYPIPDDPMPGEPGAPPPQQKSGGPPQNAMGVPEVPSGPQGPPGMPTPPEPKPPPSGPAGMPQLPGSPAESVGQDAAATTAFKKDNIDVTELPSPKAAKPKGYVFDAPEGRDEEGMRKPAGDVLSAEETEALIEAIIDEKWEVLNDENEKTEKIIEEMKNKLMVFENELKNIKKSIDEFRTEIGEKHKRYDKGIDEVNIEMDAFGKAMRQVVPSLSSTVRELKDTLKELREEKGRA